MDTQMIIILKQIAKLKEPIFYDVFMQNNPAKKNALFKLLDLKYLGLYPVDFHCDTTSETKIILNQEGKDALLDIKHNKRLALIKTWIPYIITTLIAVAALINSILARLNK